ncbi:hypothetical protein NH340_JMT08936 [Sarcoptes scabiei]|nr:hypothetical protein NH340_JMT08936 [Sarcoptes scabiei]
MDSVNIWRTPCENGGDVQEKTNGSSTDSQLCTSTSMQGPDPNKLKALLEKTNYSHQVTAGQRKYGGPPPNWPDSTPPSGCEIFVGKIPREIYEDELIPLFEKIGKLWDLRLMIDPTTSQSRGYAFITYCNKEDALKAVQELDGHRIGPKNYPIKVNISVPNLRLFIGNIPKIMSKEHIFNEFKKVTDGLIEVITYSSPDDRRKNRGFCFLEFDNHKNASAAKRKLTTSGIKIFKCEILVDWADPQEEPDEETMSKVKVLYVRNLTNSVTEQQLTELFEKHGQIERVKKIKDYAFVHFEDRNEALQAMERLNNTEFGGSQIEISLAKPPSDRRKKEEMLRNREKRMLMMMQQKQILNHLSRVPQTQIRPPLQAIPPLNGPSILPISRNGRNRFSQPFNPMLSVPYHRQNLAAWDSSMFYDSPDLWWQYNRAATGAQFNFPNIPPNAQWNYGLSNGQIASISPYMTNGVTNSAGNPNRRNNNVPGGNSNINLLNNFNNINNNIIGNQVLRKNKTKSQSQQPISSFNQNIGNKK